MAAVKRRKTLFVTCFYGVVSELSVLVIGEVIPIDYWKRDIFEKLVKREAARIKWSWWELETKDRWTHWLIDELNIWFIWEFPNRTGAIRTLSNESWRGRGHLMCQLRYSLFHDENQHSLNLTDDNWTRRFRVEHWKYNSCHDC